MRNSMSVHSLLTTLCLSLVVPGGGALSQTGPATAGPNRPAGVPASYVITPNGYFHPSCVKELAEGDIVLRDKHSVQHRDGTSENIQPCNYPHYGFRGEATTGNEVERSPEINGWVEDAYIITSTTYGGVVESITVPSGPESNDGQTVYLFPGLEDIDENLSILQPVLGWNAFSNYPAWSIASWNCCFDGNNVHSSPNGVSVGDYIIGEVFSNCDAGTLSCPTWFVSTEDAGKGSTSLSSTSNYGQTFNWAFGGVLEAYSAVQCSDYPESGSFVFETFAYDENFEPINDPSWTAGYGSSGLGSSPSGLTPQCNYGVSFPGGTVTLYY